MRSRITEKWKYLPNTIWRIPFPAFRICEIHPEMAVIGYCYFRLRDCKEREFQNWNLTRPTGAEGLWSPTRHFGWMHDVYRNALLTLVATSASNAYAGFLSCRLSELEKAVVPYISLNTQKVSGSFHLLAKTIHHMDQYFDRPAEATYWNSRGWTFQERHSLAAAIAFLQVYARFRMPLQHILRR